MDADPSLAMPIGVGDVANGGNSIDVKVDVGPFAGPVNISFVVYAPAVDDENLYFMRPTNGLRKLSKAMLYEQQMDSSETGAVTSMPTMNFDDSNFSNYVLWKTGVTAEVNQTIFGPLPLTSLPSGPYTMVLTVKSADNANDYYRWITHVTIP